MGGPFVPDVIGGTAPPAAMRPVLKLHALRPVFRELGRPAAFVYEAQTRRVVWNLAGADAPDQGKFGTVAGRTGSGSTTPWCASG